MPEFARLQRALLGLHQAVIPLDVEFLSLMMRPKRDVVQGLWSYRSRATQEITRAQDLGEALPAFQSLQAVLDETSGVLSLLISPSVCVAFWMTPTLHVWAQGFPSPHDPPCLHENAFTFFQSLSFPHQPESRYDLSSHSQHAALERARMFSSILAPPEPGLAIWCYPGVALLVKETDHFFPAHLLACRAVEITPKAS